MNKITIIGNVASEIKAGATSSGVNYCRFSVAVNRRFTKANGDKETDFFNILCWRGLAETCKNLTKGKKVAIMGECQINKFMAKDGANMQTIEILADDVEFLSPRDKNETEVQPKEDAGVEDTEVSEGDLPF